MASVDSGVVLVDKPKGWTSFDVVAKVRSVLGEELGKRVKVGHSGTLDPFATGLMIVAFGKATKRLGEYLKLDKTYTATLYLGASSTTGDPEGMITKLKTNKQPTPKEIESAIAKFTGAIDQIPPIYSAIKVGGQPAYKRARRGEKVVLTKRQVTVYSAELLDYQYPEVQLKFSVSSGTYIRVLGEDIAKALGTTGYLTKLRRLTIGKYLLDERTLDPTNINGKSVLEACSYFDA